MGKSVSLCWRVLDQLGFLRARREGFEALIVRVFGTSHLPVSHVHPHAVGRDLDVEDGVVEVVGGAVVGGKEEMKEGINAPLDN